TRRSTTRANDTTGALTTRQNSRSATARPRKEWRERCRHRLHDSDQRDVRAGSYRTSHGVDIQILTSTKWQRIVVSWRLFAPNRQGAQAPLTVCGPGVRLNHFTRQVQAEFRAFLDPLSHQPGQIAQPKLAIGARK